MNRADLQRLTNLRIREAEILRAADALHGAYYLLGYAVECALKACIAKGVREHDFPDKKLVQDSYTHDVSNLLRLSGLKSQFDEEALTNPAFGINWTTTKDWSEAIRFDVEAPPIRVQDFFSAVLDPSNGVMQWLKQRW